jgi:hypothetical protein
MVCQTQLHSSTFCVAAYPAFPAGYLGACYLPMLGFVLFLVNQHMAST